jgi:uncharacterized protein YegP (UPF0339 family)
MATAKIEVWEGHDGKWYFHVKNRNGRVTGPSQGYGHKRSAVARARRENPGLPVVPKSL